MALKRLKSYFQIFKSKLESKIPRKEGRIYIFPTRIGLYYSAGVFVCFLLAITYGNSLSYVTTFLLLSFMLSITFVTNYHLKDIFIRAKSKESIVIPTYRDEVSYIISNTSDEEKMAINIDDKSVENFTVSKVSKREIKEIHIRPAKFKRGVMKMDSLRFSTEFPFSLFRSWSFAVDDHIIYIAPKPLESSELSLTGVGSESGESKSRNHGIDDYQGLNKYDEGQQVSRIDWKNYSKREELYIKSYSAQTKSVDSINVLDLEGDIEEKLAKACFLILRASDKKRPFTFKIGNKELGPGINNEFIDRCLKELALYE